MVKPFPCFCRTNIISCQLAMFAYSGSYPAMPKYWLQNFKVIDRKPSSGNPLIFESVTEMSLPIINGSNGSREKFSFNLILCRFFSFLTFYNFFIFFFIFRFCLGFYLSFVYYLFAALKE